MKEKWKRVVVHVDMDAFFAAIEQLINPELRGKPVIVGADPREGKGRGVVSTASYEARRYGVHSAMPISKAYSLCPNGIYLKPNGKLYSEYSHRIFDIFNDFTPRVQIISIDEAFLDVTGSVHLFGSLETLGKAIKQRIFTATSLTASVGIAPSKSVAKIASDFQKPDGLTIVEPHRIEEFLDPLAVTKLWGVGNKVFQTLSRLGIQTVGQLRQKSLDDLEERFGKMGLHLYRMARGIDEREVHDRDPVKSISHETTFMTDQTDPELLLSTLLFLSEKVSYRLRKSRLRGKTIQLKIRFDDFSTFMRHKTLHDYTNLTEVVFSVSKSLFEQFRDRQKPVRLMGVGITQLKNEVGLQTSLWDIENERKVRLQKLMDQLQEKYGNSALTHADTLTAKTRRKKLP